MNISRLTKSTWLPNTILFASSVLVGLVTIELLLRAQDFYQEQSAGHIGEWTPVSEFSATRHHRLIPNASRRHHELEYNYIWANNALGMRDRERSAGTVPKDTSRILFLGDSMVQGYGVPLEESMVSLLETRLNQYRKGKAIEVFNAGVFGYSPMLEYLYLLELAPNIQPDLVLIGIFVGNDVGDDYFYSNKAKLNPDGEIYFQDESWPWTYMNRLLDLEMHSTSQQDAIPESLTKIDFLELARNAYNSLLEHSRLLSIVHDVAKSNDGRASIEKRNRREEELVKKYREDIRVNLGLVVHPVLDRERRLELWEISLNYLLRMDELCRLLEIPMILVVIPDLETHANQFQEPYQILDEFGKQHSIPVIQLFADMREIPAEELTYPLDGHWNALGNRLAADSLYRQLLSPVLLETYPEVGGIFNN